MLAIAKPAPSAPIYEDYLCESLEIVVGILDTIDSSNGCLVGVDFVLRLQAFTTFICAMGFKQDFETAQDHLNSVNNEGLPSKVGDSHVDVLRSRRVSEDMGKLRNATSSSASSKEYDEVGQIIWRLAHRWIAAETSCDRQDE